MIYKFLAVFYKESQVVLEYFLYPKIRYGFHSHVWSLSVAARSFKDGGGRGILMQQKPEKSIKYYLILSQHKIHGPFKEKESIKMKVNQRT